ncbi:radical SAM protein [Oryzomonas japonica]|uniref:Radical SAM protein n=1 Tax=Oryzomonas japonica TaxID=2603858 RepID=A0A7J4ZNY4_9BACT|nr:radical SAM protein [Oryzomonas japonica]KAB0664268.1 radical SAM protein [Oryzomonas japonica]
MKVFLIYIRDEDFYRLLPAELGDSRFSKDRVQVMAFPPIGIETLAPIIRRHGHEARMFDTCHPQMKAEHIACAVRTEKPDVIALSFLSTTAYPATRSMAQQLKQAAPDTPIIVGGVFATINAKEILADTPDIDYVARGEGEELLPEFLENLGAPGTVGGLVWRSGGDIVENAPRPVIEDLDQFPYPDRKSLPIDYIESMPLDVPAVLSLDRFCTMQTSRGCPYQCIYCGIPSLANRKWRHRSPEHVLGEMQQLNDEGYRSIYLTDDQFLLDRKRIGAICQGIIDRKFEFNWGCEGRVDSVATDQFPIMAKAHCNFLAFGVEAGTQKVLDRIGKMQTMKQVEDAVSLAKRHGIETIHGFFLVGSPDETAEDILESFRFAARLKLDTFGFNRLCAYRGTPLWQDYVERGIIDDKRDWNKWFKCSDIDPTILPGDVVNRARQKGYMLLFANRLFLRPFQTIKLLRRFGRFMKKGDIMKLLMSPFRKRILTLKPSLPSPMIDLGLIAPVRKV